MMCPSHQIVIHTLETCLWVLLQPLCQPLLDHAKEDISVVTCHVLLLTRFVTLYRSAQTGLIKPPVVSVTLNSPAVDGVLSKVGDTSGKDTIHLRLLPSMHQRMITRMEPLKLETTCSLMHLLVHMQQTPD